MWWRENTHEALGPPPPPPPRRRRASPEQEPGTFDGFDTPDVSSRRIRTMIL